MKCTWNKKAATFFDGGPGGPGLLAGGWRGPGQRGGGARERQPGPGGRGGDAGEPDLCHYHERGSGLLQGSGIPLASW